MGCLKMRRLFLWYGRYLYVMSTMKRLKIGWTLKELLIKIAVMCITIAIGLWCGWTDSFGSFYIAALVQAVNNIYDACAFFGGYTKFITVFQIVAFFGAIMSAIFAIIHFTSQGSFVDSSRFVIAVCIALSIPVLHFLIEVYNMVREDQY